MPWIGQPVLLDADNCIVRNIMLNALDDLKAGGVWTGGVFGTLRMLASLLQQPEMFASGVYAFFDGGIPPRRKRLIPTYKQERADRREMLSKEEKAAAYQQKELCWELFEALGFVCVKFEEREADDCLAAATRWFVSRGQVPTVVSGDRDLFQCVNLGANVWYLNSKTLLTQENFSGPVGIDAGAGGVHYTRYLLFKTLMGDQSDSIRGVVGVKEKRAAELVNDAAAWIDAQSKGQAALDDYDGLGQLEIVREYIEWKIGEAAKLPKRMSKEERESAKAFKVHEYEKGLVRDYDRLRNEMMGIDLSKSFGSIDALDDFLTAAPQPNRMDFLRFCKRLNFQSVLASPEESFRPFVGAAKHRDQRLAQASASRAT